MRARRGARSPQIRLNSLVHRNQEPALDAVGFRCSPEEWSQAMGSQYAAGRRRGRVIFNNRRSAVDCFVRALTDFGATLEVTDARSLPSRFHLLIDGEASARDCTVRHTGAEELGVVFTSNQQPEATFGRKVWSAQAAGDPPDQMSLAYVMEAQLGIVLVDAEMRAPLVNDEFCRIWKVPDALAESCPPLRELIFRGLGAAANVQRSRGADHAHQIR